jgi:hypothetical protein
MRAVETTKLGRAASVLAYARETLGLLIGQGLDDAETRSLIQAAYDLFANIAYAASQLGEQEEAFDLACKGRAQLLATALHLQTLDLPPERLRRLLGHCGW